MSSIWTRLINLAGNITGVLGPANGGTGIANNASSTLTISGSFPTTLTVSNTTGVTLPTTGTLLANSRSISTTAPLTGGGDLSADRTLAISAIAQSTSGVDSNAAQRLGTNTNDGANAGNIGEDLTQVKSRSNRTSITSATDTNVTATKLTLSAGDWELSGMVGILTAASTTLASMNISISKTSATGAGSGTIANPTSGEVRYLQAWPSSFIPAGDVYITVTPYRITLSGSQDFYLVANFVFAVSTAEVYGYFKARRLR